MIAVRIRDRVEVGVGVPLFASSFFAYCSRAGELRFYGFR